MSLERKNVKNISVPKISRRRKLFRFQLNLEHHEFYGGGRERFFFHHGAINFNLLLSNENFRFTLKLVLEGNLWYITLVTHIEYQFSLEYESCWMFPARRALVLDSSVFRCQNLTAHARENDFFPRFIEKFFGILMKTFQLPKNVSERGKTSSRRQKVYFSFSRFFFVDDNDYKFISFTFMTSHFGMVLTNSNRDFIATILKWGCYFQMYSGVSQQL